MSLGDAGSLTVFFANPITDGVGADFAVFENAFGLEGLVFAELAFVSVSSDGVSFATFAVLYDDPTLDEQFGSGFRLLDVQAVNNFAGIHETGVGTGFDLYSLATDPMVELGLVDLAAIHFVRLTDAIGDGSTTDAFGHPILDPYATAFATGGFDLDAVGAINTVPISPPAFLLASALFFFSGHAPKIVVSRFRLIGDAPARSAHVLGVRCLVQLINLRYRDD